jgi:dTDP-4-amino-4,6-dideoxygalactose transaminase
VIRYVNATVVFADVDPDTQNLTVETIDAVRTPATRAVIGVHQAGMPLELDPIRRYCDEHGLALIEDAACAIGSTHRASPIGSGCRYGVFSFHPRKILTTGEGGMLVTDDDDVADRATSLREHGTTMTAAARHSSGAVKVEQYAEVGFNYRMTDIQAAVGLVQLGRLDEVIATRRRLADRYREMLAPSGIVVANDPAWGTTNHQSLWVRFPSSTIATRDEILEKLATDGISARRGIMAAHLEPAYEGTPHGPLPVTERLTSSSLILPLHHFLSEEDQLRVVDAVSRAAGATT